MCVEMLKTVPHFSGTIDLKGHMTMLSLKNECFPIYLLRNPINVY